MKLAVLIVMISKMISYTIDSDTLQKVKEECERRGIPDNSLSITIRARSFIPFFNIFNSFISNKLIDINVWNVGKSLGMEDNIKFYIGYWDEGRQIKISFHISEEDEVLIDELSSKEILALSEEEQYSLLACLLLNYYYGDKTKLIYSNNIGLAFDMELIDQLNEIYDNSKNNLIRVR